MNTSSRRKTVTATGRKDATLMKIQQMEQERANRRKSMMQQKEARKQEHLKNIAAGNPGDVDFIGMVQQWRRQQRKLQSKTPANTPSNSNICIAVRKRPMSDKERQKLDHDSVSCFHNKVWIHSAKLKVDGITKYLTHTSFQFDYAFDEESTTEQIYVSTTMPLVDHVVKTKGRATVFCYGQTGSGKTFTMNGIQQILAHDLYSQLAEENDEDLEITVAFFELYGGYVQDLLHNRARCQLLDDGKGEINIRGLCEVPAPTAEEFLQVIEEGNSLRTTHATEANDSSSRSHAICQVFMRDMNGKLKGKLGLVDLAGSERGSDTKSHNSQRRTESAEINKSLLALKECIRSLGLKSASHVNYRGSKLTLILKDCFSGDSKTTMIATVSPGASATDHSVNTLRYADRIKEQRSTSSGRKGSRGGSESNSGTTKVSKERLARIADAAQRGDAHQQDLIHQNLGILEEEDDDDEEEELLYKEEEEEEEEAKDSHDWNEEPTKEEEEEELRRTVQGVFELEEALLSQHMSNIQENAEMLTREGKLLQSIQAGGISEEEMDNYAIQLAEYLDQKEALVYQLQSRLVEFQQQLAKEQALSQRITTVTQY